MSGHKIALHIDVNMCCICVYLADFGLLLVRWRNLVDDEPWHSKGIRRLPIKNFLVYFWIDEDNMTVQITVKVFSNVSSKCKAALVDLRSCDI